MTRQASTDLPAAIAPWPLCAWNRIGIAAMNSWIQRRYGRMPASFMSPSNRRCFR